MKKTRFFTSLPFKLLVGVIVGIIAGLILSSTDSYSITMGILNVVVTLKYILGQLINFCVPLIIIGFIAPSITKLGNSASRMLGVASCYRLCFFHRCSSVLCCCRLYTDSTPFYRYKRRRTEETSGSCI